MKTSNKQLAALSTVC